MKYIFKSLWCKKTSRLTFFSRRGSKRQSRQLSTKRSFQKMSVKSRKGMQPEYLPPTNGSAWQHSLRVLFTELNTGKHYSRQISARWNGEWQMKNEVMEPVMTLQVSFFLAF